MVPEEGKSCLGLEYFCQENDGFWNTPDTELVELAATELERLGLAPRRAVRGGAVVRMPKAYPVYDGQYKDGLALVRRFVETTPGLQLVGRNGMHRYNNQDHSMLTAMYAVENMFGAHHDVWNVNVEQEYHEERTTAPPHPNQ